MPTLIEEELARRDAAREPVRGESGRASYMRPDDRLRAEALDYRREHDAELMAAREALMEQRAAQKEAELTTRADHYQRMGALQGMATEISKAKAELAAQEQATKDVRSLQVLNDSIGFLRDAVGMNPASPEFDMQLQKLYAGYPMAASHPSVERWQSYHLPLREKFVAEEIARRPRGGTITTTDENGVVKTTITKPLLPEEEQRMADLKEHRDLENRVTSGFRDKNGVINDPSGFAAEVTKLNAAKAKLGFDLLDPATGQVIPKAVATTPAPSPAPTPPPVPTPNNETPPVATPAAPAPSATPTRSPSPAAPAATVWRAGKDGTRWEYDAQTKQPTGRYVKKEG